MPAMSLLDGLFSIAPVRKALWRLWYPFLTRRLRDEDVLFLNYAFQTDPAVDLVLDPADEPHRACIQLYHHVVAQAPIHDGEMLEVSCGHGGGASWITRTFRPRRYTAIDLNPAAIRFCQQRHPIPGLSFRTGDACHLPFPDRSCDTVINVEASHCYPDFPAFLAEVTRVLRPGGHFVYADFRFGEQLPAWEHALATTPLTMVHSRDISDEVLRGMSLNAPRSERLVTRCLPRLLHAVGRDFAGIPGARVHEALRRGEMTYRSYCFRREASATRASPHTAANLPSHP
jgi:SAM-dependent methyltransferase